MAFNPAAVPFRTRAGDQQYMGGQAGMPYGAMPIYPMGASHGMQGGMAIPYQVGKRILSLDTYTSRQVSFLD